MIDERSERGREFPAQAGGLPAVRSGRLPSRMALRGGRGGGGAAIAFLVTGAYCLLTGAASRAGRDPDPARAAVAVGAFLIAWLAIWTMGGSAPIREALRLLVRRDRVIDRAGRDHGHPVARAVPVGP